MSQQLTTFFDADLTLIQKGSSLNLEEREFHHLFTVRRARNEDKVWVYDGRGAVALAVVSGKNLLFERVMKQTPRRQKRLHIMAAQLKSQPWEWLLEKLTEFSVTSIQAIVTSYVEQRHVDEALKKSDRFRQFCIDGMKQSGTPFLPEILSPISLESAVIASAQKISTACHIVAVEPEGGPSTDTCTNKLPSAIDAAQDIFLWTGPEGGWTESDLKLLQKCSPSFVSFEHVVFRAETAVLFFVSNILYAIQHGGKFSKSD